MINLLPPESRQRYQVYSFIYTVITVYIFIVVALGLTAASLATYNFNQNANLAARQTKIDELKKTAKRDQDLAVKAGFIQDRLTSLTQFHDPNDWSKILSALAPATPNGVQLVSVKLAVKPDQTVSLSLQGTSTDQRLVILFKDKLASDKTFTDPEITDLTQGATTGDQRMFTFTIEAKITTKKS
jgi:Tfp pilus assembly protein PilN